MIKKIKNPLSFVKENLFKKGAICIIIFLLVIVALFIYFNSQKSLQKNITIEECQNAGFEWSKMYTLTETQKDVYENLLISSDVYLKEINEICPDHYKTCLSNLFNKNELASNQQFEKLIKDLNNTKITRENLDYFAPTAEYDYIIDNLKKYKDSWSTHRKVACELQNIGSLSGSGYEDFIKICILNEIQKFSLQLSEIDKDYNWIPKE
ncbi:MAG: hypothetical protein WAV11_03275 [Minisyncoccia bacterium]